MMVFKFDCMIWLVSESCLMAALSWACCTERLASAV